MSNSHTHTNNESPSTEQPSEQVWEQMSLFEWGGITDESDLGFAIRSGL